MTEAEAFQILPTDAKWSCSFGYPGEGRYSEYYRTPTGQRWIISREDSYDYYGWDCKAVIEKKPATV